MSKRIPVYLSEEELKLILSWAENADTGDLLLTEYVKLHAKLEEQLATFEET